MSPQSGMDEEDHGYYASSEGGVAGRDAANMESIYHVDLDDIVAPTNTNIRSNARIDNQYDLGGEDYSEDNNKDLIPREIKFHGAKKYSKKIKEELGNYLKISLTTSDYSIQSF